MPLRRIRTNTSREKWSVWVGMCGNGVIIGPIFLERNLKGEIYLEIMNDIIIPHLLDEFGDIFDRLWWAQDEAPAHRLIIVHDRLNEVFNNRVTALGHQTEWPLRASDQTPCYFFLWGYINNKVLTTPRNLIDLRKGIITDFNELKQHRQIISKSVKAMRTTAELCVERNGGHVEEHESS